MGFFFFLLNNHYDKSLTSVRQTTGPSHSGFIYSLFIYLLLFIYYYQVAKYFFAEKEFEKRGLMRRLYPIYMVSHFHNFFYFYIKMRYAARPYNDKILFSVHEYNFCLRFVVESISEARRE